jgi:hypothetical protein
MGAMRKHLSETTGLQRLSYGLVAGLLTAALPLPLAWPLRGLLGWCAGIGVYLLLAWWLCMGFDARRTRERAQAQDEPSVVIFLVLVLATLACVGAIVFMMQHTRDLSGLARTLHVALSMAALAASWLFIQAIFAFHYAHCSRHRLIVCPVSAPPQANLDPAAQELALQPMRQDGRQALRPDRAASHLLRVNGAVPQQGLMLWIAHGVAQQGPVNGAHQGSGHQQHATAAPALRQTHQLAALGIHKLPWRQAAKAGPVHGADRASLMGAWQFLRWQGTRGHAELLEYLHMQLPQVPIAVDQAVADPRVLRRQNDRDADQPRAGQNGAAA